MGQITDAAANLDPRRDRAFLDELTKAFDEAGRPDPWVLPADTYRRILAMHSWSTKGVVTFCGSVLREEARTGTTIAPEPDINFDAEEIGGPWEPQPGRPFRLQDLTPVRDRLIVAPLAVASRSKGGIHLVETGHQRERPQHGIVLATGAGVWNPAKTERVPVEAAVGDCVFYGKYSGQAFDIGDREVLNMSEAEVFSILRQGAFVLVEHENPKLNHLQGDFCDLCATPEELAAKARLEADRVALVEGQLAAREVVSAGPVHSWAEDPETQHVDALLEVTAKDALEAERERMRQKREATQG